MTNIITFTTDWGSSDNYSAIFKAHILREMRDAMLCDISHDVGKFNITTGIYLLKSTYHYFPEGTIHVFDVDFLNPQQELAYQLSKKNKLQEPLNFRDYLAVKYKGHYFLAINNGVFSILCEQVNEIEEIVKLKRAEEYSNFKTFNAIRYFVRPVIALAKQNRSLSELGETYSPDKIETIKLMQPLIKMSEELGDVIEFGVKHIDSYGNIITDLHRDTFAKIAKGRDKVSIYIKGMGKYTVRIANTYSDVPKNSSMIAIFNLAGYLEIASKYCGIAFLLDLKISNVYDHRFTLSFIDHLE
jgi:S-adenosylmethionine hydrolase